MIVPLHLVSLEKIGEFEELTKRKRKVAFS